MKYFKIIGPTPEEDAFVATEYEDDTPEKIVESFDLGPSAVVEITRHEYEEATKELFIEDLEDGVFLNDQELETTDARAE